jgi:gamma-glutamyltranspeptidase / glutathione hydrolase
MRQSLRLLAAGLLAAAPAAGFGQDQQPERTTAESATGLVEASDYMVVAAHPLASEAGVRILAAGGSAADAAVAVQMVLNLVEPQSSGIGGGAFLLYWNAAEQSLTTFDGRETAPAAAAPDYWLGPGGEEVDFYDAVPGGQSVGVPGTLKLMETIHDRFGRLPWAALFEPAIALAESGFPVSQRLSASIADEGGEELSRFEPAASYFFDDAGTALAEGDVLKNPDFARTLRLIAAEGSDPFYHGSIARDIVATTTGAATNPGVMTLADLETYDVIERPPVCVEYRAYEVCGMGPPSSGGLTVGQILGILDQWDLGGMGRGPAAMQLYLEASKLAYADRALYMADPDFVDVPEGLLDPGYLKGRAGLIDPETAMPEATAGEPPWDETRLLTPAAGAPEFGTSHFVIVDAYGDMVSTTTTIEQGFGSRLMTGGFLLNNELTDFSFDPGTDEAPVANRVEGGKRPRSSMAPTIVLRDGAPVLLIGSPGGSRIIPYVAQSLINILDFGMDPKAAIDAPHVLNRNGDTEIEPALEGSDLATSLADLGQVIEVGDLNSGLHVIEITPDVLVGAADKRREGLPLGE